MSEHFTRNTIEIWKWCAWCGKKTTHAVSNGIVGRCENSHTERTQSIIVTKWCPWCRRTTNHIIRDGDTPRCTTPKCGGKRAPSTQQIHRRLAELDAADRQPSLFPVKTSLEERVRFKT